ncbi:hypothetical protein K402DRAFT_18352 [Aulographum hederae CBS 113979]|uniref:Uncharacterized protein n=1 Tax=Aulographum hederae CBS 113979 TaxID=1176131 RepID=A0A6G1H657_9PEZI|nr:hypothetical protein K402DRAFT_18352 [Aulographum hederae CBS 113979]
MIMARMANGREGTTSSYTYLFTLPRLTASTPSRYSGAAVTDQARGRRKYQSLASPPRAKLPIPIPNPTSPFILRGNPPSTPPDSHRAVALNKVSSARLTKRTAIQINPSDDQKVEPQWKEWGG